MRAIVAARASPPESPPLPRQLSASGSNTSGKPSCGARTACHQEELFAEVTLLEAFEGKDLVSKILKLQGCRASDYIEDGSWFWQAADKPPASVAFSLGFMLTEGPLEKWHGTSELESRRTFGGVRGRGPR